MSVVQCPKCQTPMVNSDDNHVDCPQCGFHFNKAFSKFYEEEKQKENFADDVYPVIVQRGD